MRGWRRRACVRVCNLQQVSKAGGIPPPQHFPSHRHNTLPKHPRRHNTARSQAALPTQHTHACTLTREHTHTPHANLPLTKKLAQKSPLPPVPAPPPRPGPESGAGGDLLITMGRSPGTARCKVSADRSEAAPSTTGSPSRPDSHRRKEEGREDRGGPPPQSIAPMLDFKPPPPAKPHGERARGRSPLAGTEIPRHFLGGWERCQRSTMERLHFQPRVYSELTPALARSCPRAQGASPPPPSSPCPAGPREATQPPPVSSSRTAQHTHTCTHALTHTDTHARGEPITRDSCPSSLPHPR